MSLRNLIPILFLTFWSAPAFAQSEQPSIVVLGLEMYNGDDEVARELTMAVRMALLERGGVDVSDRMVSASNMVLVNECAELDDACLTQTSVLLHEQYLIYGTIRRIASEMSAGFLVSLSLYDHGVGHTIAHIEDQLNYPLDGGEAVTGGRRLIERLFEGVTLHVEAPPPPVVEPVVTPPITPPVTPPVHTADHSESDWAAVGWTMLGVAVASFAADIGIWARLGDLNNDLGFREYRTIAGPSTGNVCLAASGRNADICSEGNSLEIAEYVVLGVGISTAAVGATILILQSVGADMEHSGLALRPSVSPTSGALTLSGTF